MSLFIFSMALLGVSFQFSGIVFSVQSLKWIIIASGGGFSLKVPIRLQYIDNLSGDMILTGYCHKHMSGSLTPRRATKMLIDEAHIQLMCIVAH